MNPALKDRTLIKAKDVVLIVAAILGFVIGGFKFVQKPYETEHELNMMGERVDEFQGKYGPVVDSHSQQITILKQQNIHIIRSLDKIEKKIDRISEAR